MDTTTRAPMSDETRKGVIRWLVREIMGTAFSAVILFWAAGTINWVWGWLVVALYAGWTAANAITLIPLHPELLVERANRSKGMKRWDTILMSFVGLLTLGKYIVAGLDFRNGWSADMPLWLHLIGLLMGIIGYTLVTWSMNANAYFSMIVRVQEDRGHQVATTGPYKIVRHPGYLGSVLFEIGSGFLLGSWWVLLMGVVSAILFIIRTGLEDRTLREELDGYEAFTQQTRFRLFPGIW